jgi:[acyl-carrier-protein] S-malonyltransferase
VVAATVGGVAVAVADVDSRERELRSSRIATALPAAGTREGRQLRRWLTQLLVTERVVAAEADQAHVSTVEAPSEADLLPDMTARLEIGSIAAAVLADPQARALFVRVTAAVQISDDEVAGYHARNPLRFAGRHREPTGWRATDPPVPELDEVRSAIHQHLLAAARRSAFRRWLDARQASLVVLAPGYEHPGDPRQPDNTHQH